MTLETVKQSLTPDEISTANTMDAWPALEALIKSYPDPAKALQSVRKFISMIKKPTPQEGGGCEWCQ